MKEEWKICNRIGFSNFCVSNTGQVKNIERNSLRKINYPNDCIGYVTLAQNNNVKQFRLDWLVIKLFLNIDIHSWNIVHKDGDIKNCRLNNLSIKNDLEIIGETWKNCTDFDSYDISSFGRAKRRKGKQQGVHVGLILKPKLSNRGYLSYGLYNKDGKIYWRTAHSLVAREFIGKKPKDYEINHKDGDKSNNHFSNLEYCTPDENKQHAVDNNLVCHGERKHCAKITEEVAKQIKIRLHLGETQRSISKSLNLPHTIINDIKRLRSWRRVTI